MEVKMWKKLTRKWQTGDREKKRMRIIYIVCAVSVFGLIIKDYFRAE